MYIHVQSIFVLLRRILNRDLISVGIQLFLFLCFLVHCQWTIVNASAGAAAAGHRSLKYVFVTNKYLSTVPT